MAGDEPKLLELLPEGRALLQDSLIQIVTGAHIAPLPSAGKGWAGVANLRGNLIGVVDLGFLLGFEPTVGGLLVAVNGHDLQYGLLCEGISGPRELPAPDELPDEPSATDPDWLRPSPPGEPRVIDTNLLLEDPRLGADL